MIECFGTAIVYAHRIHGLAIEVPIEVFERAIRHYLLDLDWIEYEKEKNRSIHIIPFHKDDPKLIYRDQIILDRKV